MNKTIILLFSRDRAMQLEAVINSFFIHCRDAENYPIYILYTTTSERNKQQYERLQYEYLLKRNINFHSEKNFRYDVFYIISQVLNPTIKKMLFRLLTRIIHRATRLSELTINLIGEGFVLFLVDDNLFVNNFYLSEAIDYLKNIDDAVGFSLRLGRNTTYSYIQDRPQMLPEFSHHLPGILEYSWSESRDDFGYPLELSSSIYRLKDALYPVIQCWFSTPNQLESCLAKSSEKFLNKPKLLCFERSVTFCNPLNKVQKEFSNRSSINPFYSIESLADIFDAGGRIDVNEYNNFLPSSCHQEVPLKFIYPISKDI